MNGDLLNRVERLEKRDKILVALVACCVSAVAAVLLIAASGGIRENITARSITVIGSAGKNSASLAATRDGFVQLAFQDMGGKRRGGLLMTPSGKLSLGFDDDKVARLVVGVVGVADGEEFSLQLRDASGKPIWQPQAENKY